MLSARLSNFTGDGAGVLYRQTDRHDRNITFATPLVSGNNEFNQHKIIGTVFRCVCVSVSGTIWFVDFGLTQVCSQLNASSFGRWRCCLAGRALLKKKSLIEFDNVKYPYSLPPHLPVFLMGHLNIQSLDIPVIHVLQMSGAKKQHRCRDCFEIFLKKKCSEQDWNKRRNKMNG